MAKKQEKDALVFCKECVFGGKVEDILMECNNKDRNPQGYKVGVWARQCRFYKKK